MTDGVAPADSTAVSAVGQAFRAASTVNRAHVSMRAGLVAAIPVAGMLALGTALDQPTAAVTMGVGAMLSGVAWRSGDAPLVPPVGTMLAAGLALVIATMAGTLTGRWPWLHLGVLVVFCLIAGCATVLGRPGAVVGTQSLIAFIVFGRFPEGIGGASIIAGLVLAGALAQTGFALLVAVPAAWRRQRSAVAAAYAELAQLADAVLESSAAATAATLDRADAVLAVPALFADPKRRALSDLVDEGRRIRLELIVIGAALLRERRASDPEPDRLERELRDALAGPSRVLALVGDVVRGEASAAERLERAQAPEGSDRGEGGWLEERLAALVGQVRAAARIAAALVSTGDDRYAVVVGRPSLGAGGIRRRAAGDLRRIRESATLQSNAGRHALRLAVVVAGTELLIQHVALPRAYWAVVAAATVLRPEFAATFTRGAERVLGTCAGVVIAGLIAVAIDPSGWGIVAVVAILAFGTYTVFAASFTLGIAGLTGIVVFLLHVVTADSIQLALDRGIDTIIGGVIGLAAYALWPTWSGMSSGPRLADLVDAQRAYLDTITAALIAGRRLEDAAIRPLARAARVAWTDAASAVSLARSEPRRGDVDPQRFATTLGALRRVVWSIHALRLEAVGAEEPVPAPALAELARALDEAMATIASRLRGEDSPRASPPLRRLYLELDRQGSGRATQARGPGHPTATLQPPLDELIDAIDTAAVSIGLELP